MSVEWAFEIDESDAVGAASRLERSLHSLDATASGVDSKLAQMSAAELDAAISAGKYAAAVNELELSMVESDTNQLTVRQLELVKAMKAAEMEAKRSHAALGSLAEDETRAATASQKLDKELMGMSQAELRVAQSAQRLSSAHEKYESSLRDVARGTGKLGEEQYDLAESLRAARKDMADAQHGLETYNKSIANAGSKTYWVKDALGQLGTVAKSAGLALVAIGAGAVAAAGGFAVEAFHALDFARSTESTFAAMTGSVEEGAQALNSIRDAAKATGAPLEELRKTYGTLRAAGVADEMATDLSKMRMDWLAMGEEGEAAFGKLTDAMVEGYATASMFEDLTKNLAGMGVSSRADFGKALGLSEAALGRGAEATAQLDAELQKMDPRKLLDVAVAVSKANGPLGQVSLNAKSFGERLDSLKEFTMQTFVAEMGISGDAIGDLLGRATELVESDDFKVFARSAGDALVGLGNIAVDVAGWIVDNWETIGPTLKWIGIAVGTVTGILAVGAATLGAMFSVVPALAVGAIAGFVALSDGISGIIDEITGVFGTGIDGIKNMIVGFAEAMYGLGAGIIDGLLSGIQSRIGAVLDTVRNLASSVSSTFAKVLDIHSPSGVFEDHAGNIVGGLTRKMDLDSFKAAKSAYGLADAVQSGFVPPYLAMSVGANDNASKTLEYLKASAADGIGVPVSYDVAELALPQYQNQREVSAPSYLSAPSAAVTEPYYMQTTNDTGSNVEQSYAEPSIPELQIPEPQVSVTAAQQAANNTSTTTHQMTVGTGAIQITVQDMDPQDIQRAVEAALENLARRAG